MLVIDFNDFKSLHRPYSRLAAIDLGSKTLGIALSDIRWKIASPLKTLPRTKLIKDCAVIKSLMAEHNIVGLIWGLPINMDGTHGSRIQATQDYVKEFSKIIDVATFFWDERLTTVMAERTLLSADLSRKRRNETIDKVASAIILQCFLDRLSLV